MKNKFILRLLMIAILVITIHSCRDSEILAEHDNASHGNSTQLKLSSKKIRLEQSKHKLLLKNELERATNNLKKIKTNVFGKNVDYTNNILIDTDNVTFIENGPNFHTYTFNLIRENAPEDAPIENLVLAPMFDGTYKEILISYNLTIQEKKAILRGENLSTKGKSHIMELNGGTFNLAPAKSQNCSWVEADSYTWCSEGVHHNGEGSGSCSAGVKSQLIKVTLLKCESVDDGSGNTGGGGSSGGSGGGGNPGGGGSGGGTPTEPCNGNGVATGPLDPSTDIGDGSDCTGIPTIPTLSTFFKYVKNLPADLKAIIDDAANNDFYDGLKNYYDASFASEDSKNIIRWALAFKQNNSITWQEFLPMLGVASTLIAENPDIISPEQIFTRMVDLDNAVKLNPNLLLDIDCAQLSQLDDWSAIANHSVPQTVKDKMQNIKNQTSYYNNWMITDLDDGLGARLNMDLFPVKITTMPNKPGTNQKYTTEEFFQFFRKNINLFAEKFSPIKDDSYGIDDTALWFSNNPLGALIHIKIPADDGTVVCSGYYSNTWIFSTVKAPLDWYHDGIHPVAGNRAFSYYTNPNDGSVTIYTRGVDRVSRNYSDNTAVLNHILLNFTIEQAAFMGADNLWTDMQEKLKKYIEDNGGQAGIVPAVKYRPKYSKIKDYIKGKLPITSLSCN
ncbi:hypothetical protein [Chryseobacterium indoltheticum]|uniref:Uncharacterized protein n=1 Tax=Chryseobacterium indoltheticum TaxID=254 RepID=A0A381FQH7_9FLAO|nr:hypothetical protein [Chryseobacterium indoltheticum]SUX48772.1 Uncharacterised protein [Chryseobacterium indoltheticum]